MKNHLTVTTLQPRGLVALISSLGTFSASWSEIEELNLEIINNEKSSKNDNNYNVDEHDNDINISMNMIINNKDNKDNITKNNSENKNNSETENKNGIQSNRSSLSFVFSETAERYFPDLSNAEVFQVRYY